MSTIDVDTLETELRKRVRDMITQANLPKGGSWARNVEIEPLFNTGTAQDRFNDGKYRIKLGMFKFVIDRGTTREGVELRWKITVNTENGEIIAVPILNGSITPTTLFTPELLEALGFPIRKIGTLGKLLTFVPEGSDAQRMRLGIPVTWGTETSILRLRHEWAHLLTKER